MPSQFAAAGWLAENGPKELELLFRAIVFQSSTEVLRFDFATPDSASGIGRPLSAEGSPERYPLILKGWRTLGDGEKERTIHLTDSVGCQRVAPDVPKENLSLVSPRLAVCEKQAKEKNEAISKSDDPALSPPRVALALLNADGEIVAWYAGPQGIYGYRSAELIGQPTSLFYPDEGTSKVDLNDELKRATAEGHSGVEGWQVRKDDTRFWANVITMALRDGSGKLQGFARVVRDFNDRHNKDELLRRERPRTRPVLPKSTIACMFSGEFDRIDDANDSFLDLIGYSRQELLSGGLRCADLTPPEYLGLDGLAHEEALRFGACSPFEKEMVCRNGTRAPVLVTTAVLKLSPFRWITFVQDLRERNRLENIPGDIVDGKNKFEEIIGNSTAIKRVMAQVEMVAPTDATVLILGETGTGKELIARAIHRTSPRANLPFVSLNCAAIPTGLLESELFGYEKGAFTGALSQKIGRFEMAHRGTLFLDEVGDIPLDLQPKLLRALQEKAFERLGGTRTIPIDVRLLAATNRNLTKMMGDNLFRSDLYYRLKVFPITTPPLRDHPEDIQLLAWKFTKKYAARMNRTIEKIPSHTMQALVNWTWPGNVRELENLIERSVILSTSCTLQVPLEELRLPAENARHSTLQEVERDYILQVLRETEGIISNAAARLGMPRTTLNAMMKKLGISRRDL